MSEPVTLYTVLAIFPMDDVPVFVGRTEKECVDFLLRHSTPETRETVRLLAEEKSSRHIPAYPRGFDMYQLVPAFRLVSSDGLPAVDGDPFDPTGEYNPDLDDDDDDDEEGEFDIGYDLDEDDVIEDDFFDEVESGDEDDDFLAGCN